MLYFRFSSVNAAYHCLLLCIRPDIKGDHKTADVVAGKDQSVLTFVLPSLSVSNQSKIDWRHAQFGWLLNIDLFETEMCLLRKPIY